MDADVLLPDDNYKGGAKIRARTGTPGGSSGDVRDLEARTDAPGQ
jgi:hypothetical protein